MKENDNQNDPNDILTSNTYTQYEIEAQTICVSSEEGETKNQNNNVSTLSREEKIKSLKQHTNESLKLTDKRRSSQSFLKSLVSQDKNRFCFDGYDLDLTYITPRIIAMGLPSTSLEALYRNNLTDVLNFFNERHPEHYKVYNLCEEKNYAPNIFYKQGYFPFQDHEAPPLNLIRPFCEDAKKFLDEDPKNVVAIHCLAGKGRTGTLISCLLLYLGELDTAADCLKYYGLMRVDNGRGVTVPSQIRYVFYFEQILRNKIPHPIVFKKLRIRKIRLVTIPAFSKVTFVIENKVDKKNNVFDYNKKEILEENAGYVDFEVGDEGFVVCGDVKILFYTFAMFGGKEKIFKIWFNTNFVPKDDVLEIKKDLIDKACKDKKCKKFKHNFKIEVHMIDEDN
jgi:phosphatidylinositol-3,4,5-trisphosphate 3-phosphatase/dual-specificity protein phosphatase PTEN